MLRRIARNTAVQILGKGGTLVLSMTGFSLMTRYLGPELYGRYNIVFNVMGMAGIVAELGLTTIATRELAAQRERIGRILPAIFAIRLTLGMLGVAVATAIGLAFHYDTALVELITLLSATFIIRGIGAGAFGLLSVVRLAAHWNTIAEMADACVYLSVIAVGVATHQGLAWFVAGAVASALVNSALIYLFTRRMAERPWTLDFGYCRTLLRAAIPLSIAGLFSVLYFRIDALMLSKLGSTTSVGIYGAAYKFVDSAAMIGIICTSSFFPLLSYYFDRDRAQFAYYYSLALEAIAVAGASTALTIFVFADSLILLLNGPAFGESIGVLRICCAAIVLMFVNNVGANLLFASHQQKQLVWINLLGAIGKVAINFLAIPYYGPAGAAAATAATEVVIGIGIFAMVARHQKLPSPLLPLAKLALFAGVVVAIMALTQPSFWERAMLMCGWALFLLLIGMPRPRDVVVFLRRREEGA